jgi:hypothetical protein
MHSVRRSGEIISMDPDGLFGIKRYASPMVVYPDGENSVGRRHIIAVADFNGDGLIDLLWREEFSSEISLATAVPDSAEGFVTSVIAGLTISETSVDFVKVLDVDLDGTADLLIGDPDSGFWWAAFLRSTSPGGAPLNTAVLHMTAIPFEGNGIVVDANGDGLMDLVTNNSWGLGDPSDTWKIWLRRGPGSTQEGPGAGVLADLLVSVTDGHGATVNVRYESLARIRRPASSGSPMRARARGSTATCRRRPSCPRHGSRASPSPRDPIEGPPMIARQGCSGSSRSSRPISGPPRKTSSSSIASVSSRPTASC